MSPQPPRTVLVVGSAAREHALAWRLAREDGVERVLVAPGNPLMTDVAEAFSEITADNFATLIGLCRRERVDLVVVGPEAPLAAGIADAIGGAGIACLGPSREAAQLEASKAFCRAVCSAAGVPMAEGAAFADVRSAQSYAIELGAPLVVKADGLAAGKGVSVCDTVEDAARAIDEALVGGRFGPAGSRVVVERRLEGREASLIALCDGTDAVLLPPARDHKRLADGDRGPNTGGMGAYSPVEDLDDGLAERILETVHRPVLREMARRGRPFRGFLYAGLMLTADGPRVLEFNARLGDPEAQAILPRIDAPLAPLFAAAAGGRLAEARHRLGLAGASLPATPEATVALTVAAAGYPDAPRAGDRISGLEEARASGALVFGAGVSRDAEGRPMSAGGRVLTVVGSGTDITAARAVAYAAVANIQLEGMQMRRDIGAMGVAVA